jgi:hypothetical protein
MTDKTQGEKMKQLKALFEFIRLLVIWVLMTNKKTFTEK